MRGRMDEREHRERSTVYDGWHECRTLEDVEEQERLLDTFESKIGNDPRGVLAADVAIARERLKMQRRAIGRYGEGVEPGIGTP